MEFQVVTNDIIIMPLFPHDLIIYTCQVPEGDCASLDQEGECQKTLCHATQANGPSVSSEKMSATKSLVTSGRQTPQITFPLIMICGAC